MSDWRSKPRNGRAEFLKHEAFIQARIAAGETHKAIYQYLGDHEELDMSLSQFNRYINKLAAQANNALTPIPPITAVTKLAEGRPSTTALESLKEPQETSLNTSPSKTSQKSPLTPEDLRKIRRDVDNMDLNALIQGKGVVPRKELG